MVGVKERWPSTYWGGRGGVIIVKCGVVGVNIVKYGVVGVKERWPPTYWRRREKKGLQVRKEKSHIQNVVYRDYKELKILKG